VDCLTAPATLQLAMSTKSREVIGGQIMGAKMRAQTARQRAQQAAREADRAVAEAWSVRMEGYGGPAQPSPTIGQCINGGLGWLEVECKRCKARASLPLDATRRPGILRSGSWRPRSSVVHAERGDMLRPFT
jgi:hypothetical protein